MSLDYEKLEKIGTVIIENDKFHELILSISNKGFFDYITFSLYTPSSLQHFHGIQVI